MDIMAFLESVVDMGQLKILAYLIMANFGLGVLVALWKGKFELAKLKDIWKKIGIVFGAYLVATITMKGLVDFAPMATVIYVGLVAYISAELVRLLKELGIPIPDGLMKWVERAP